MVLVLMDATRRVQLEAAPVRVLNRARRLLDGSEAGDAGPSTALRSAQDDSRCSVPRNTSAPTGPARMSFSLD